MNQKPTIKLHAIQLVEFRVSELSIKVDLAAPPDSELGSFTIETSRSDYDNLKQEIQVRMALHSSEDDDSPSPMKLRVEVLGRFKVDESTFDVKNVEDWAEKNAPFVLYPYVRELVYSLTSRSGFTGALLPLLEIPTFKFNVKKIDS